MDYPYELSTKVKKIFGDTDVKITLYSGLTTFVGTNASGKTQTLKAIRNKLKKELGREKVRYLSSNRIGVMEQYRSKTDKYTHSEDQFNLGDRDTSVERHQIETANGDFFTLDSRKDIYIKVAERLSILFGRNIFIRWDAGYLKVFFSKTDAEEEYSIIAEASGLVNIISILTALFDESVEVLLIDEPEVSLHPQLQSFLLREIKRTAETRQKTIIISTHSAEMIELETAEDLCSFVFFNGKELPKQISPDAPELCSDKLKDFVLRMSLIYHAGFFAKKVLLIEGASDLIMCRYLCNRLQLNLDVAGSQIIPVDGKGQFPLVTKLFRLIGKDVCILTDLDGFTDDNDIINLFANLPHATEIANRQGCGDLQSMVRDTKTKIAEMISANKANMKAIYELHPYWANREKNSDENKILCRAIFAQLFSTEDEDLKQWPNFTEWRHLKTRLSALLMILEELGCFVLRKGAIESYYSFAPKDTYDEKPSAAVTETSGLKSYTDEQICSEYADLIRALKYAALEKTVDESFAVKKELYSELALVLGILKEDSTEKSLLSAIKQGRNSTESLFEYAVIHENSRLGVNVSLRSEIINVDGFPFKAFVGDNVIQIIDSNVHQKIRKSDE